VTGAGDGVYAASGTIIDGNFTGGTAIRGAWGHWNGTAHLENTKINFTSQITLAGNLNITGSNINITVAAGSGGFSLNSADDQLTIPIDNMNIGAGGYGVGVSSGIYHAGNHQIIITGEGTGVSIAGGTLEDGNFTGGTAIRGAWGYWEGKAHLENTKINMTSPIRINAGLNITSVNSSVNVTATDYYGFYVGTTDPIDLGGLDINIVQANISGIIFGTGGAAVYNIGDLIGTGMTIDDNGHSPTLTFSGSEISNLTLTDSTIELVNSTVAYYDFDTTEVSIENGFGKIDYVGTITESGTDLSQDIKIENNNITIASSTSPGLNISAELTLYNIAMSDPKIIRDGVDCTSATTPKCEEISYGSNTLVFNVTGFTSYWAEETSVCGTLGAANTVYTLTNDVSISGSTCFTITAQNVTLNCSGFSVTGDNTSATNAVYSTQYNTTIQNCNIDNFDDSIYFDGATNGLIENVNVSITTLNGAGIHLTGGSTDNQLNDIWINSTQGTGLYAGTNSQRNNITGLTVFAISTIESGLDTAVSLLGGVNNTVDCQGGTLTGGNTTGNYGVYTNQDRITIKNCNIENFDEAIVFEGVSNGLIENVNASSTHAGSNGILLESSSNDNQLNNIWVNSTQYRAIVIDSTSHRNNITGLTAYGGDTAWANTIQISGGENNTIDCAGGTITGTNTTDVSGITSDGNGTIIKNCNIENSDNGINFYGVNNALIEDVNLSTTHSGGLGVYLTESSVDNQINNVWINSTKGYGIVIADNSHRNNFTGLTAYGGTTAWASAVNIESGINNTIDCQGETLSGKNTTDVYGIASNGNGTTIKNCNIENCDEAIYFGNVNNGLIENVNASTTHTSGIAIRLSGATDSQVNDIWINSTKGYGIHIENNGHRNNITGLTAYGGTTAWASAVNIESGINNTIDCQGETLSGKNTTDVYGIASNGNGTTIKNCNIENCDEAIYFGNVNNGLIENVNASTTHTSGIAIRLSGATDSQVNDIWINSTKGYGIYFDSNSHRNNITGLTVYGGSTAWAPAVNVESGRNNTIDCASGTITGTNTTDAYGISISQNGTQIKNCKIDSFPTLIRFYGASDGLIQNNTLIKPDVNLLVLDANSGSNTILLNNFTTTSGLYVSDANGTNNYNG
ncbi:hypothetical protein N9934_04160, partial [Desulfosarcina sp.]|nr:hypothetical protein [Desulfosarcina sp.]